MKRTGLSIFLGLALLAGLAAGEVRAADWPKETITILVGQQPGSGLDVSTRVMAEALSQELGVAVIVKNVPGGGGRVAYTQTYTAAPDGYLLCNVNVPTICIGEVVFGGAYKSQDMRYVYAWTEMCHVLAVRDDSPLKTLDDFVKKLKSGRTTIATFGHGTSSHLQMAAFADFLGARKNAAYVHFEGGPRAMAALVGGNVDAAIVGSGGYVRRPAKVRGLAYISDREDPDLKDHLKPASALGYTGFPVTTLWIGVVAPPKTPEAVVQRLSDACLKVSAKPDVQEKFKRLRTDFSQHPAAEFQAFAQKQYQAVVKLQDLLKRK